MIECPSCGAQHRPGTLFCSECGVYLLTGGPLRTEPLPNADLPVNRADPWLNVADTPPTGDLAAEATMTILTPSGRQLALPSDGEAVLGRLDATRGVFPNIDLTPEGGLEGGVSRRHARIHKQQTKFFIEDLGSANGTFLNGQRLTAYLPHPLHDNDEIQLGRVKVQVVVSKLPKPAAE
ncbi:MAG TPA: FHA domain-containing protein [Anaerolineae bacterium]|nr:FHA domain-containing protein [Anaerolineae bacterium]